MLPDPNGYLTTDSECVNSKFGNAESYLAEDVPAFARGQFDATSGPDSLAIGGLSAGGTCSVMLALRHPQVYPTFVTYSGFASPQYQDSTRADTTNVLFGGSEDRFAAHDPLRILRTGRSDGLAGWFEVGDQDTDPREGARSVQPAALKAGIATGVLVRPGGTNSASGVRPSRIHSHWLTWRLGLIPKPAFEPATCEFP